MENETQPQQQLPSNSYAVPASIIIAGLLVGGAVIYSGRSTYAPTPNVAISVKEIMVEPVAAEDHVLGNRDASLMFIEYSDTECPYCKAFHKTMHSLIDEYGKDGKVAWTYRHFPIAELHSKAPKEAEALECANELGGNQKFWQYTDKIYEITPSNDGLDPAKLHTTAESVGLSSAAFKTCLDSGKHTEKIKTAYEAAVKAGGNGTPYTVILLKTKLTEKDQAKILSAVTAEFKKIAPGSLLPPDLFNFDKEGNKVTFSGALPYEVIKGVIDTILTIAND